MMLRAAHHLNPDLKPEPPRDASAQAPLRPLTRPDRPRTLYAQLARAADSQVAEEAAVRRRMLSLLAIQTRVGKQDAQAMAEAMMTMLRGRKALPGGNLVSTMAAAVQYRRGLRRRVRPKPGTAGGRRWSKGLHPGLWSSPEGSGLFESFPPPEPPRQLMTETEIGVVAIR